MELQERKLFRCCTIDEDIQQLLLKFIKDRDWEQLKDLLEEGIVDVNHIYDDTDEYLYEEKTAIQIACLHWSHETSVKCIQLLLDYGADVIYVNSEENAINYAAEGGNPKILQTILHHFDKKGIDYSNSNAIYSVVKYVHDSEMQETEYIDILNVLLNTDIDINLPDKESGWTAIYTAAKYGNKNFVNAMIRKKYFEINLDEFKDGKGNSARKLIQDKQLFSGNLPQHNEENSNISIYTLYKNLRERNPTSFEQNYKIIRNNLNQEEQYTLLCMAVKLHVEEAVKFLLNEGTNYDKNYLKDEDNPLETACKRGYYKIVKILLTKNSPNSKLVTEALISLLKISNSDENTNNINYNKCLELLLKDKNININDEDWNKNTALHYAIRYQNSETVLKILRNGASLACKDSYDRLAVADLDAETFETHLNECIRYENEELSTGDDACLVINVSSLLPPRKNETIKTDTNCDNVKVNLEPTVENNQDDPNMLWSETDVLQYMCTSQELKQLLKHPVILAFLYLKWYRIRMFFFINLFIYMLFVISLLTYITVGYNKKSENAHEFLTWLSYLLLTITFTILVIREISQLIIFKHKYFFTFENWLEIVLLIVTAGILIEQTNETQTRQFSAIAIVAAAIEFLLLVGQFPAMSTNIMMLRTVSFTFFKLLLWYSILLIAFAYSFYTLFQETEPADHGNATTTEDDEEQDFFEDPGMSLLKTIVMLTGEFDAASIKFNTYPVISHLIFVMFVFLIAIVLFNLLNGLAVSDTQIIKNDAELYGQILRVEHISHIERVLLTNRIIRWVPMVKRICLFPLNISRTEIFVYPNKNAKVALIDSNEEPETDDVHTCYKEYFNVYLDKKVEKAIRSLMKDVKEEAGKRKNEKQILDEIAQLRNMLKTLVETR